MTLSRYNVNGGFTLLEVLIYFALITLILLAILGILNVITRVNVQQTAKNEVERNIDFVNRRFTYWGLSATSTAECGGAICASPTSSDAVTFRASGDKKIFYNASAKAMKFKDGSNPDETLTTNKVEVSLVGTKMFEFIGSTIQLKMKISYKSEGNPLFNYSKTSETVVTIR